ncbi:MAG TPA: WD40 repeat domain-containing protein, partial [Kofleriaceae bacterium]|nr:WD40 repeat domain-containing protein [Kofleriaceae bacterium]
LARELRCLEGRARTEPSIRHGLLAAVDQGGHAIVCDLAAEQVTSLIPDAVCARALDRDRVGVVTAAGELAIFARSDGWQLRRRIAIGRISPDVPVSDASCDRDIMIVGPHALALRSGAAAWQLVDLASFASMDLVDTGDAGRRPLAISADRRSVLVVSSGSVVEAPVGGSVDPGAPVLARSRYVARDPTDVVAVVARDGEAAVIDVQRRQVIRRDRLALDSYVSGFERTPDGRMAVAATVRGTLVWWPLSGEPGAPWLEAVSESVLMQIAFNRSGTRLVWRDDLGAVGVRDVGRASGHELVSGGGSICDVGFATDDRVVAMSCDGRTLAWDLTEERTYVAGRHDLAHCRPECSAEATAIWSAAVDRSGSVLATAGSDGTVGIWPLRRDERGFVARRLSIGTASRAFAAVFFGDRLFVGPHDSAAQLWDWRAGTRLVDLPGHETWVYTAALARPAGEPATLVTGAKSGTLRFWSEDGLVLRAVTKVSAVASTRVNDLAVSPSGRLVAAALDTGEVAVCDAATGAIILRKAVHRDWARRVLFLDEETVLSAGDDGLVQQIAVRSGAITSIRAHDRPIYDVDRHGSSLLTASVDGTVRLWDLRDGSRVRTYVGHEGFVGVVRWHPDGTRFVTGSRDGRACVWQIEQDTCHDWLIGHHGEVRAAQFIDGDRVVTAAKDGTARVWTPVLVEATVEDLSEELDRRAPACLDEQQRRSYLDESASDASARTRACRSAAR